MHPLNESKMIRALTYHLSVMCAADWRIIFCYSGFLYVPLSPHIYLLLRQYYEVK